MSECETSLAVGDFDLGLSVAALANNITYATGNFVSGKWSGFNFPFKVSMVGTDNTISLATGILRRSQPSENPEVICFSFSGGTVSIKDPAGRTVFTHKLKDGLIVREFASVDVEISASLVPNNKAESGSTSFHLSFSPFGENARMEFGSAAVSIVPAPEPRHARAAWNWLAWTRWFGILRAQRRVPSVLQRNRVSLDQP